MSDELCQIAEWLAKSRCAIALTGAGISTESGIPDFRSPGGIWSKYRTVYFDEFIASAEARHEYWRQKAEGHREFSNAKPNLGHQVLARWEQAGKLRAVITQNIDELHQQAGSKYVLELHGTARKAGCLSCHVRFEIEPYVAYFLEHDAVPECPECGGILKHATVSFGQSLPAEVIAEAYSLASETDLMFAIGSSLVVTPAADLPRRAKEMGARLVIINRNETPLDPLADCVVRAEIGPTLAALDVS